VQVPSGTSAYMVAISQDNKQIATIGETPDSKVHLWRLR
jgi:hypothetical protein